MTDFDNTNRGVLFKNNRKEEGDKKPEYTGSLNVDGVEFFLDAWLKTAQSGSKFMSVSIKRKDKQAEPAANQANPNAARNFAASARNQSRNDSFDDGSDESIPF